MTLLTALLLSVIRAVAATTLALLIGTLIAGRLSRSRHPGVWLLVCLAPLLVPELLVGFTYRLTAPRLAQAIGDFSVQASFSSADLLTEAVYCAVLLARATAVVIAVQLMLNQSTVSPQALHLWRLLKGAAAARRPNFGWWITYCRLLVTGPWRPQLIGWCVAVLLCFQEFETAALLQLDRHPVSWSVWVFDAHAAGEPLIESLKMLMIPLAVELLLLVPVIVLLKSGGGPGRAAWQADDPTRSLRRAVSGGWLLSPSWLALVMGVFVIWPLISNAAQIVSGLAALAAQPRLLTSSLQQIATSLVFAIAAALIALQTAMLIRAINRTWLAVVVLLPGLLGSLVLSLVLLAAFQTSVLNPLYDSWLPMLLGLCLLMLPRAFLLAAVLDAVARPQAVQAAKLLNNSADPSVRRHGQRLVWQLVRFRWWLAVTVLVHWSFWDVTVAAILRPLRFETVVTRLYNEMHYGRTETLTAITVVSLLLPLAAVLTAALVMRQWSLGRPSQR